MGDSAHTSGFAACTAARRHTGTCPPAAGNAGGHAPPNTGPAAGPHGRPDAEEPGAGGWRSCSGGPCMQLAPRPRTKAPRGCRVGAGRGPNTQDFPARPRALPAGISVGLP